MATSTHKNHGIAPVADPLRWYLQELDVPAFWRRHSVRCVSLFLRFVFAYALLCVVGYTLSTAESQIVVFWPAAGLLAAILACSPRRTWPLWMAGAIAARVTVDLVMLDGRDVQIPLGFSVASCAEALILAVFIKKPLEQSFRLRRPLYLLAALLILSIAATAVGGLFGAAIVDWLIAGANVPFWVSWRLWVAADLLGIIVVAPVVSWLFLPQIRISAPPAGALTYLALVVSMAAAIGLSLIGAPTLEAYAATSRTVSALVMTLPLFWAAARFPYPVAMATQFIFVVAVVSSATASIGPFAFHDANLFSQLAQLQVYLCVTLTAVLLFVFVLMERQRAIAEMRMHRGLGSVLVTLTDKLVNADADSFDKSIDEVLEEIAEFARADRCILFQIDPRSLSVNSTHRWVRPGVGRHADTLLTADPKQYPWVLEQFSQRGYIVLDDFSESLPDGADELREIQRTSPTTRAAVYMGLFTDGVLTGVIGCGYTRKGVTWSNEALSLMYLVGQLFANVLNRKNVEKSLKLYQDKLRSLASEVALTEERARRQTAIDLHDGIGQNLAVARMKVGQLLAADTAHRDELTQLRHLVDEALRGTRFIISDLSPSILYELGLVPALQSLAERFETANDLRCSVAESGIPWEPGNDMRIALYRAVQEFLSNIARHARAEQIDVLVEWGSDRVDIVVTDDGVGFDVDDATTFREGRSGFGLFSVRESIRLIGGTLKLESALGIGSKVTLCVPREEEGSDQ